MRIASKLIETENVTKSINNELDKFSNLTNISNDNDSASYYDEFKNIRYTSPTESFSSSNNNTLSVAGENPSCINKSNVKITHATTIQGFNGLNLKYSST